MLAKLFPLLLACAALASCARTDPKDCTPLERKVAAEGICFESPNCKATMNDAEALVENKAQLDKCHAAADEARTAAAIEKLKAARDGH